MKERIKKGDVRMTSYSPDKYEVCYDKNGQLVVPGDLVSFGMYPRGTGRGIVEVSPRVWASSPPHEEYVRALVIRTDDGTVYNMPGARKLLKLKRNPVKAGGYMRRNPDEAEVEDEDRTYTYDELDPAAQRRAFEEYANIYELEYEWWEYAYETIEKAADALGISIQDEGGRGGRRSKPAISFDIDRRDIGIRGSYSYKAGSVSKAKALFPGEWAPGKELVAIAKELYNCQRQNAYQITATLDARSGWSRSGTSITVEMEDYSMKLPEEDEDAVKEALDDFVKWAFKHLEDEYEGLTSRETLEENIRANDYQFDEDGNML